MLHRRGLLNCPEFCLLAVHPYLRRSAEALFQNGYEDNAEDDDRSVTQCEQGCVRLGLAGHAGLRLPQLRRGSGSHHRSGDTGT